jgi:streptogramin lyase
MLSISLLLFGSDGALWFFSGEGSSKVGRMNTSGTMLGETQIPGVAYDAAVGSDGNVWFTTSARSNRSSLVEMTSSKTYAVLKAAKKYKACVIDGLANGPDGNLWFGAYTGNSQCSYGVGTLVPND